MFYVIYVYVLKLALIAINLNCVNVKIIRFFGNTTGNKF